MSHYRKNLWLTPSVGITVEMLVSFGVRLQESFGARDAFEKASAIIVEEPWERLYLMRKQDHRRPCLDHDETCRLYQCLHELFHPVPTSE